MEPYRQFWSFNSILGSGKIFIKKKKKFNKYLNLVKVVEKIPEYVFIKIKIQNLK